MVRSALARLGDYGQSVWCDEIGREFLSAGRLKALVADDGISGVTSNPTIFHKAITGGSGYDKAIKTMSSSGVGTLDLMEALIVSDIRLAADQLQPVYLQTRGRDGWVSIEVAPACAYDGEKTISEVIRVRSLVKRPNLLIKVPATKEGVVAVRELTALGHSINVTLIFSLERYREVIEAYLAGLEMLRVARAAGRNLPALSDVHGVASFFVSRVDSAVDKHLDALVAQAASRPRVSSVSPEVLKGMRGKAAIASAKQAYRLFRRTFSGPRWDALQEDGATVQRPLWASTSTKDPSYSDIIYVQEIIGPDTVNTMPLKTLDAFRDHGNPAETITAHVAEAAVHLDSLGAVGVDLKAVTEQLEREGVQAFADSFEALSTALDEKRRVLA
jgi:transaldolase